MQSFRTCSLFFYGVFLWVGISFAQNLELATLQGLVTDSEGNPLPGVKMILSLSGSSLNETKITGVNGEFEYKNLQPGMYTVEGSLPGFVTEKLENIDLKAGETKQVKFIFHLDANDEDLMLRAGAPPTKAKRSARYEDGTQRGRIRYESLDRGDSASPQPGPRIIQERSLGVRPLSIAEAMPEPAKEEVARRPAEFNTEAYDRLEDNPFLAVDKNPLSTFSIDVDTASYSNVRSFLTAGQLPPKDAVRIEELINYFPYEYPQPQGADPFSVHVEVAQAPWNLEHRLVKIGLKGKEISKTERPACNLVFLLDVSGSMEDSNKLPLVKKALKMLANNLNEKDRVAIVVYAGATGLALASTGNKGLILDALEKLESGGSTNGGAGIVLAYNIAKENFIEGGVNRVILATDGDFNVGVTSQGDLTRLIEEKAKTGVFLTVLGFGMGNYKDATLEKLADKGNGNYAYIDTEAEAKKVLVQGMGGTLVTIAKDVKIQVEFNPAKASAYRLIGYENRMLKAEDFKDDKKDAGEIGAGHTVTALYEVVPFGLKASVGEVDPLKYQKPSTATEAAAQSSELLTVKLRSKKPDAAESTLQEHPVEDGGKAYTAASEDFKFAAAVAAFGMILRESPHKGTSTLAGVAELAEEGKGADREGYRAEFLSLVKQAKALSKK